MESLIAVVFEGVMVAVVLGVSYGICCFLGAKIPFLKDKLMLQVILVMTPVQLFLDIPILLYGYWGAIFIYLYYWDKIADRLLKTTKWMKQITVQATAFTTLIVLATTTRHFLF